MRTIRDVDFDKIRRAITLVLSGNCTRVDVSPSVKVYECKDVIRIDLKISDGDK